MEMFESERTDQDLYDQQLLQEHDLKHKAEVASRNYKKAELTLAEAKQAINGLKRIIPFLSRDEHSAVEAAKANLDEWSKKVTVYTEEHADSEKQLDVITLTKIRNERPPEYQSGIAIKDFYGLARKRVEVFRIRVRDFLKALGQARGAMSTGYNNASGEYTSVAMERLSIAQASGRKLDAALADIELLETEFQSKASSSGCAHIKMTKFSHIEYEQGVKSATTLPIAQAQMQFDQTLKDCEELRDQGINDTIQNIDQLEGSHEDLMLEIVRRFWHKEQRVLLSNSKRISVLRGYISE